MTEPESDIGPDDVIAFWFAAGSDKWFTRSDDFDEAIRDRFGAAVERAGRGEFDDWRETPEGALALVLLLDQFTRNIYRGSPLTWAFDGKALETAAYAIDSGHDMALPEDQRRWFYMPYMHSEDMVMQRRSIELSQRIANEDHREHADHHADIIARFGRFPHRNEVLGRRSTPEEVAYLADGGFKG